MIGFNTPEEHKPMSWYGGHRPAPDDVNVCAFCGEKKYFPDHLCDLAVIHRSPAAGFLQE